MCKRPVKSVSRELIHETQTIQCYGYNFARISSDSTQAYRQHKGQLACPGVQVADRVQVQ